MPVNPYLQCVKKTTFKFLNPVCVFFDTGIFYPHLSRPFRHRPIIRLNYLRQCIFSPATEKKNTVWPVFCILDIIKEKRHRKKKKLFREQR